MIAKIVSSLVALYCTGAIAQTNINIVPPHQYFFSGGASYTDTTNVLCPVAPLSGYSYPSNFTGVTRWQFNPEVISSTNNTISFSFLTTNVNTTIGGYYRVILYTNDTTAPFYDSGEIVFAGTTPLFGTNVQTVKMVNNFPVNTMGIKSSLVLGTVYYKNGLVAGNWYTSYLLGGEISFK